MKHGENSFHARDPGLSGQRFKGCLFLAYAPTELDGA